MIAHALTIVKNELDRHFSGYAGTPPNQVELGNLAEGLGNGAVPRDKVILALVNIQEEKTLKNVPNHVRNDLTARVTYQNAPVFLNLVMLVTATHANYTAALNALSRAILFFQVRNVLTQDNVDPSSINGGQIVNALDRLETFTLIFDLYSPTIEEINYLWGTLGGKQYPFAIYRLRMLEMKLEAIQSEGEPITEVVNNFTSLSAN